MKYCRKLWRNRPPGVESSDHLREVLAHCRDTPGVHLIDCPVDYTENDQILNIDIKRLSKEL